MVQDKLLREALGTEGDSLAQNVQQVCDLLELREDGQPPAEVQVGSAHRDRAFIKSVASLDEKLGQWAGFCPILPYTCMGLGSESGAQHPPCAP